MYADDMALLARSKEELEKMMAVVAAYSRQWRFRLNAGKTKVLVVGEKKKEREARAKQWLLGGAKVEEVAVFKYLGVEFRADGKWKEVAERLGHKAGAVASMLLGVGGACEGMGMGLRRRLWLCLGLPVMQYGSEVWEVGKGDGERLEMVQRQAGRRVLGCSTRMSDEVVRGELGWVRAKARRDEAKLRFLGRLLRMSDRRGVRRFFAVRVVEAAKGGKGWCVEVLRLVEEYKLEGMVGKVGQLEQWHEAVKAAVVLKEEERWRQAVTEKPSLGLYGRIKTELRMENHADGGVAEWQSAVLRVRLRGAGSELEVQRGKLERLERQERVCRVCGSGAVEDEAHFLLDCTALRGARDCMWRAIETAMSTAPGGEVAWGELVALPPLDKVRALLGADMGWPDKLVLVVENATRREVWNLWRARKLCLARAAL
jgi:hypothetical protein